MVLQEVNLSILISKFFYVRSEIRVLVLKNDYELVMYCRSYRTGFVWHDLCEDDLILPAHGNEYVLKGSELFDEPNSGKLYLIFIFTAKICIHRVENI